MKKLIVAIRDDTKAELIENLEIKHLSELGDEVKDAIDDFVKFNRGAVLPPVSIHVKENVASLRPDRGGTVGE